MRWAGCHRTGVWRKCYGWRGDDSARAAGHAPNFTVRLAAAGATRREKLQSRTHMRLFYEAPYVPPNPRTHVYK